MDSASTGETTMDSASTEEATIDSASTEETTMDSASTEEATIDSASSESNASEDCENCVDTPPAANLSCEEQVSNYLLCVAIIGVAASYVVNCSLGAYIVRVG